MDHGRFIETVKQFPQVWNRNCATFRDQNFKTDAWEQISQIMGCSATIAKDTFKSLREKYIREKEKQITFREKYLPWQYLHFLSFLDPYIIPRKHSLNFDPIGAKGLEESKISIDEITLLQTTENYSDFDKTLIALVKKASPIWDRKHNGYPSKQFKYQLWKNISQTMNKDINMCMMRWKGLREKYIRQKNKCHDGDSKWEFLDDLNFLDKVIQYRRKNTESDSRMNEMSPGDHCLSSGSNDMYEGDTQSDSFLHDFASNIKNESTDDSHTQSNFNYCNDSLKRNRPTNDIGEPSNDKRSRIEDPPQKSPEVMFGELVAAMLLKKTERDKNIAMIEIMRVLTK